MRITTLLFLGLAAAGCGSSSGQMTGGTTSGAGGGGGSSTTTTTTSVTSTGSSSCMPYTHTAACLPNAQCVTETIVCTCNDPAAFSCQTIPAGQPIETSAPGEIPPDGACCTTEGMVCGGYTNPCGPICTCTGGAWQCQTPDPACPPFSCPTDPTAVAALADQPCPTQIGTTCSDGQKCGTDCTCKLDPKTKTALWSCTVKPC